MLRSSEQFVISRAFPHPSLELAEEYAAAAIKLSGAGRVSPVSLAASGQPGPRLVCLCARAAIVLLGDTSPAEEREE